MSPVKRYKAAREEALRRLKAAYPAEFDSLMEGEIDEETDDVLREWYADEAHDRELYGEPEDTPCLEGFHCDDFGTGEGRFHGRM